MESKPIDNGAFSVKAFLAWADISRATFYREVSAGKLKIRKLGNKTLVTRVDAEAWLASLPESA